MAAGAIVSAVLEKLASIALDGMETVVGLVINVPGEVDKLRRNLQSIKAKLEDAEWQRFEKGKASVRDWLERLREVSYDIDDALDELTPANRRSKILLLKTAQKIKTLNGRLDDITNEEQRYGFKELISETPRREESTPLINVAEVKGRVEDKKKMVNMLLNEGRAEEIGSELQMISIVGMGGIGKTTLAKLAFNNEKVESHFDEKIWVCVSDTFNEMRVAKDILNSVTGDADKNDIEKMDRLQDVLKRLKNSIEGKKFLLVLDDVWTEQYGKWDQLKHLLLSNASQGSKIIVTTRKESVARAMDCFEVTLGLLSEKEGWSLFSQIAFCRMSDDDRRKLEAIGRKIANKCKGLPLALKTLGGLMRLKKTPTEWEKVLESEVWEHKQVEESLFRPLMFSYYDLPSDLRQCFSYCAIFPKGYVIEKKELIELWMARGFLKKTQHQDMEMVGEDNFNDLSARCFFQDFEMDANGGIINCKMHDMVNDFAVFLTRGECLKMESSSSSIQSCNSKARHLLLMMDTEAIPSWVYNAENLRTLLIESNGWNHHISHAELLKLFDELKCLRILKCSNSRIEQCPEQIGNLIHLRHLDLSKNSELMELPEAVCDLYNLLILDISWCSSLKRLPRRMGNLINLLHLRNEGTRSLSFMPKGMEKLTGLKTLNKFVVTRKGAALSDLGNLNYLRGTLEIEGLGIVRNVREAEKAQLQNKKGLTSLTLRFGHSGGLSTRSPNLVLEALKPPSDLKTLELYGDERPWVWVWPRWIPSLTSLKKLEIDNFQSAEQLPSLGKLPCLESLYLNGMQKVKKVGVEFLGTETSSSSSVVAFPNLKSLIFAGMKEWEDWEDWDYGSRGEIMPRLFSLRISSCPKLQMLPKYVLQNTTLQVLRIESSTDAIIPNLLIEDYKTHTSRKRKRVEEEKEIVGHTDPTVWAGSSCVPPLTNLKKIYISYSSIEHLPPFGKLPCLESLEFDEVKKVKTVGVKKVGVEFLGIETSSSSSVVAFPNLKSLTFRGMGEWEEWDYGSRGEENITIMPRLSSLEIRRCSKLKMLPKNILQSTTLQELRIEGSSDAVYLQLESEMTGHTYPTVSAGSGWIPPLTNLKKLSISSRSITYLPRLGILPSLESLQFENMEEVRKDWMGSLRIKTSLSPSSSVVAFPNLKSLTFANMKEWQEWKEWNYGSRGEENMTIMPRLSHLTIRFCPKLKMFPNYILQNTTLQNLKIVGSPIISERCKEDYQAFINRVPYSWV